MVVEDSLATALIMASKTDVGRMRQRNEDACRFNVSQGWAVLADGMGGYQGGDVASTMAVESVERSLSQGASESVADVLSGLRAATVQANERVFTVAHSDRELFGMGSTLVTVRFFENMLAVSHVGDSRLYRYRPDHLVQLTRDHSLLQEQVDGGMMSADAARHAPGRSLLTRALGVEPSVVPDVALHEMQVGDIYLMCSDGLTDMLYDDDIALVCETLSANLKLAADHLVQLANDRGGRDNITVVLIKVRKPFVAEAAMPAD
ncbi:MAG: Stp1/IreP family PP2C-type Ser/Thr phosphatase [Rhodocyclaceae bacterium]|nr:Stp1/IreP family PP2C-type Ser/Thr phosphatase [Rhodocyclaceae bacterium]